eukprot:ANDGO_07594.mRNA.1 Kinesin-II 95 kDa subunit
MSGETVRVVVRCRPMSEKEVQRGCQPIVSMDARTGAINLRNPARPNEPDKTFTFDSVWDWNSAQRAVYEGTSAAIVASVLDGYNGTIFAYGQTGAGKSFTMAGKKEPEELRGIIPNAFDYIFKEIQKEGDKQFLVRASYLEIYNEEIRDLLGKDHTKRLELKENVDAGVYVKDLTSFICKSVSEIEHVMKVGARNRAVGETNMNAESSRSHSIFTIVIETSEKGEDGQQHIRVGKLNMVDLAGSERASKTGATGDRLVEGAKINLSLSALGNVISTLVDGKSTHIPYRDSKLTRLLQDSLGGNTKTVMVANIGPADYNFDETLSTLRYANRAKNIKNKPKINEDPKDAMLREFQQEILRLKSLLEEKERSRGVGGGPRVEHIPAAEDGTSGTGQQMLSQQQHSQQQPQPITVSGFSEEQLEELRKKNDEDRSKILEEKKMTEEEKLRISEELARRNDELERERQEREVLAAKLKSMEEMVVHSGEELMEKAKFQESEIERQRRELEERTKREEDAKRELAEKEEALLLAEEKYTSLEDEIDGKTKKLKKAIKKYQQAKQEVSDLQHEFQQEREDMLDTIREYEKQLKLKMLIIDSFIPPEEVAKVERRAEWDEEHSEWIVRKIQLAGNNVRRPGSAVGAKRPTSEYARIAAQVDASNPRFRGENILNVELEMPDRTTVDYEGPESQNHPLYDGMVQLNENMPNVYFSYSPEKDAKKESKKGRPSSAAAKRPGSAKPPKKVKKDDATEYPEARGLVQNQQRVL